MSTLSSRIVAAKADGAHIKLFDKNGNQISSVSYSGRRFVSANLNGNVLSGQLEDGRLAIYEIGSSSIRLVATK